MSTTTEVIPIPPRIQQWIRAKRDQQREIEMKISGALEALTIGMTGAYRLSDDMTKLEPIQPAAPGGGDQP